MKQMLILIALLIIAANVFATPPVVSAVVATPEAGRVLITYTLSAVGSCDVRIGVSNIGGTNYYMYPTATTGDIGSNISPGVGKQIIWYPAGDNMPVGSNYRVKVIARDNVPGAVFQSFAWIDGGAFNNGATDVTISGFYLDKYELTQADYQAVMGVDPVMTQPNHPADYNVTWFKAIEYCNRRSLQEGIAPCYRYVDGIDYGTNPNNWPDAWNQSYENHSKVICDWSALGYRLPTEMEWMYAAKGGNLTDSSNYNKWSGTNTESALTDYAWYIGNNPSGPMEVGTKDPNELGLHDMSGNVNEWIWDIFGTYQSGSHYHPTDPVGPDTGTYRVVRGGNWYSYADFNADEPWNTPCTITFRNAYFANSVSGFIGVRVAKKATPAMP